MAYQLRICNRSFLHTMLGVIVILNILAGIVQATDSEAKLETQDKNVIRVPGKVSKLFPVKKSRIWKIPKDSIRTQNGLEDLDSFNETAPLFVREEADIPSSVIKSNFEEYDDGGEVDKKLVSRISEEVQETSGSGTKELSSWADLSKSLGEQKIKAFLNTLPLHILRDVTSLTKVNPELGEKKLVQLFLERKHSVESDVTFDSQPSDAKTAKRPTSTEENQIEFQIYADAKYREKELPVHSDATETGNLAIPKYQKILPEPNPTFQYSHEIMTNFHKSNEFPKSTEIIHTVPDSGSTTQISENADRELNNFTSSVYILPDITTQSPVSIHQNPNAIHDDANIRISGYGKQNPIHTFKSDVDNFLEPPLDHNQYQDISSSRESSSVWKGRPDQIHYSDIKLLSAASNTNDMYMHQGDGYNFQGEGHDHEFGNLYHAQQNPYPVFEQNPYNDNSNLYSSPNSNFHFHHPPTFDYNSPPIPTYPDVGSNYNMAYQPFSTIFPQQYQPNFNKPSSPQVISGNEYVMNDNQPKKNSSQNLVQSDKQPAPQKKPENSQNPSIHQSGWGPGSGHNSDWGPSEIWNALKTYVNKGSKSTAEKVFEVSIGLLSFIAFGGYLLMLVYQVFAVTTAFPFFPLLTPTVPQNPTLFGALFGRSMKSQWDGSYRFNPNTVMNEKYIEELEGIVKTAMGKVKVEWKEIVKSLKDLQN